MRTLKLVTLTLIFLNLFACKKDLKETEVVTVNNIEETKKVAIPENATIAKVNFNIDGMTCAIGCAAKIEKSLANMQGVKTAEVNFENKTATVEYDVAQVNQKNLKSRVLENGSQFKVSNFNTALRFLKSKDFWVSAFDTSAAKDFTDNKWNGKNVLIFGSEGFGLNKNTKTNSDFTFKIKISDQMESLNIANSVSIVCHYINKVLVNKKN